MSWIRTHRVISFFALSYLFSWWAMILYWVGVWPEPTFIPAVRASMASRNAS